MIKKRFVFNAFKRRLGMEKDGDFDFTWLSVEGLGGAEDLRIPCGSGMAGSSPNSLRMSSKDWGEIWRGGMPYYLL